MEIGKIMKEIYAISKGWEVKGIKGESCVEPDEGILNITRIKTRR